MPRDKSHEMKVGIFVTAGLAIFALFVVVLMGIGFSGEEVLYKVRFGDVAGLENGSIVRLGGLKVAGWSRSASRRTIRAGWRPSSW